MTQDQIQALNERSETLFDKLVPDQGSCETLEGELLRAINRIVYRWYNDGDYFYEGYGTESAGPAHAFLTRHNTPIREDLDAILKKAQRDDLRENDYNNVLYEALEVILDYIDSKKGKYTNSTADMYEYEALFTEDSTEADDWDEEESW